MRNMVVAVLVVVLGALPLAAQQPNTPTASLVVNQNAPGGSGPFAVNVAAGGSVVLDIAGPGLSPFSLLAGVTQMAGGLPLGPPAGTFDLAYPTPTPTFVFNGLAPTNLLDLAASTDGAGQWRLAAGISGSAPMSQFGLQALVVDFTVGFPFFVLTAATDVTIGGFTTSTITINEPGDDATTSYFHQVTSFPFYGVNYGNSFVDTNGYITLGSSVESQWQTNTVDFLQGPPRIAPYWSDMHMSSTVASAFGTMSVAPASIVITETVGMMGGGTIAYEWRNSTEAAGQSLQWDYRATINSQTGLIRFDYGPALAGGMIPASGNIFTIIGISPGGGLSGNGTSQDIVSTCMMGGSGVNGCVPFVAAAAGDAIFEVFDPAAGAFVVDVQGVPMVDFTPASPGSSIYVMQ